MTAPFDRAEVSNNVIRRSDPLAPGTGDWRALFVGPLANFAAGFKFNVVQIAKGEKRIEDLAARLFQAKAGDARASEQATPALIEANPQLANLERMPSGAVVIVPDTPHAVNAAETVQPTTAGAADFARSLAGQVTAFTSGLAAVANGAAKEADLTLRQLQDPALKRPPTRIRP